MLAVGVAMLGVVGTLAGMILSAVSGVRREIGELRGELHSGLANARTETQNGLAESRSEMQGGLAELRTEMQSGFAELRGEIAELRKELGELRERMARLEGMFEGFARSPQQPEKELA